MLGEVTHATELCKEKFLSLKSKVPNMELLLAVTEKARILKLFIVSKNSQAYRQLQD